MADQLDRSRPYGEVWGAGFMGYEQDGRMFKATGEAMDGEAAEAEAEPSVDSRPSVDGRTREARAARRAQQDAPEAATTDFAGKSDAELQALVDIAGGTWTDRDAAVAFLSAK